MNNQHTPIPWSESRFRGTFLEGADALLIVKAVNNYHRILKENESLKAENEELRVRCSMNYGGGFTQEEVDLLACRNIIESLKAEVERLKAINKEMVDLMKIYLDRNDHHKFKSDIDGYVYGKAEALISKQDATTK